MDQYPSVKVKLESRPTSTAWSVYTAATARLTRGRSERNSPQPQCVGNHGNRAEGHSGAGYDRAQKNTEEGKQNARRYWNAEHVVNKCEEKVLPDVAHRRAAQATRFGNTAEIAFYKCDVGAFNSDVCAGSHGYPDVGLCQSRSVVDAVAGHPHDTAVGLQLLNDFGFLFGQHFGFYPIDS